MSTDLEARLRDRSISAADAPTLGPIVERGAQLRRRRRMATTAGVVASVVLVAGGLWVRGDDDTRVENIPPATQPTTAITQPPAECGFPVKPASDGSWRYGEGASGASPAAIGQGTPAEDGQRVEHWSMDGIDFEVRVPGTLPVGDGDYEDPVDVAGHGGRQAPSSFGSLHHLIYIEDGSLECGSFSVHAFAAEPGVDLRAGLRDFAAALEPS